LAYFRPFLNIYPKTGGYIPKNSQFRALRFPTISVIAVEKRFFSGLQSP